MDQHKEHQIFFHVLKAGKYVTLNRRKKLYIVRTKGYQIAFLGAGYSLCFQSNFCAIGCLSLLLILHVFCCLILIVH